jgi:hypothetical protein
VWSRAWSKRSVRACSIDFYYFLFPNLVKNIHLKEKKHALMPGDNVEVVGGELVNLRGKVLSIAGDKVVGQQLKSIRLLPICLCKYICNEEISITRK